MSAADANILLCAPNWLGDGIMSLPAVARFAARHPRARLTVLARPSVRALWELVPGVERVLPIERGARSAFRAAAGVRAGGFACAYVFPNSFRSALVPFLARVPRRVGARGHQRAWMLTEVVRAPGPLEWRHQAWESFRLLGVADEPPAVQPPLLQLPERLRLAAETRLRKIGSGPWLAVLPGAERGPSKRWPAAHFADVVRTLCQEWQARALVCGTAGEAGVCGAVAGAVGKAAVSLAGETSLAELAGLLARCRLALTNDSGGMHLAAAVATPVVAVFGLTDPERTGPLGQGHRIVRRADVRGSRAIRRRSRRAAAILESIGPEQVLDAARQAGEGATR